MIFKNILSVSVIFVFIFTIAPSSVYSVPIDPWNNFPHKWWEEHEINQEIIIHLSTYLRKNFKPTPPQPKLYQPLKISSPDENKILRIIGPHLFKEISLKPFMQSPILFKPKPNHFFSYALVPTDPEEYSKTQEERLKDAERLHRQNLDEIENL